MTGGDPGRPTKRSALRLPPDRSGPGSPGSGLIAVIALVGLGALASAVLLEIWTTTDRTIGDLALIELEVRRTWSLHPPTSGAYSRFGWRHPGPAFMYVLALPYHVLGQGAKALSTGALLSNVGWSVWSVSVMRRRGPAATLAFSSCLLLMISSKGADWFSSPWNVSLAIVPLFALVIGCWGALCGDRGAGWLAVSAYVFVLQTHVGAGVVATPLALVTLAAVLVGPDLRHRHRLTRRSVAPVAVIALACLPIVIDVVRRPPGNVGRLLRWSLSNDANVIGFHEAIRMLARTSSLSFPSNPEQPRFLLWAETGSVGVAPGCFLAVVVVFGIIAVLRRRREETVLSGVLVILWISGLVAARSVLAPPEWWQVEWLQPLGWSTIAGASVLSWRLALRPIVMGSAAFTPPKARAVAAAIGCAVLAVVIMRQVRDPSTQRSRTNEAVEPVDRFTEAIGQVADPRGVRIEIPVPDFDAEAMLAGVVNESVHRHLDVCVSDALADKFPSALVCADAEMPVVLLRSELVAQPTPAGYSLLAVVDPLPPNTRIRADALRESLTRSLLAEGRDELVPTLDTSFAADTILGQSVPAVVERHDDVEWIDTVRENSGTRFGLYRRDGSD